MGLMVSVLVFSIGVLEALSCVQHIRQSYLPLDLGRKRRRLVLDLGTGSIRHRETRRSSEFQRDPQGYLRSLTSSFPEEEAECDELASIFEGVKARNVHSTHAQEPGLLSLPEESDGRESRDGSDSRVSTPATVIHGNEGHQQLEDIESYDQKDATDTMGLTLSSEESFLTQITVNTSLVEDPKNSNRLNIQDTEALNSFSEERIQACERKNAVAKHNRRSEPTTEIAREGPMSDMETAAEIRSLPLHLSPDEASPDKPCRPALAANHTGTIAQHLAGNQPIQQEALSGGIYDGRTEDVPSQADKAVRSEIEAASKEDKQSADLSAFRSEKKIYPDITGSRQPRPQEKSIFDDAADKVSEWLGFNKPNQANDPSKIIDVPSQILDKCTNHVSQTQLDNEVIQNNKNNYESMTHSEKSIELNERKTNSNNIIDDLVVHENINYICNNESILVPKDVQPNKLHYNGIKSSKTSSNEDIIDSNKEAESTVGESLSDNLMCTTDIIKAMQEPNEAELDVKTNESVIECQGQKSAQFNESKEVNNYSDKSTDKEKIVTHLECTVASTPTSPSEGNQTHSDERGSETDLKTATDSLIGQPPERDETRTVQVQGLQSDSQGKPKSFVDSGIPQSVQSEETQAILSSPSHIQNDEISSTEPQTIYQTDQTESHLTNTIQPKGPEIVQLTPTDPQPQNTSLCSVIVQTDLSKSPEIAKPNVSPNEDESSTDSQVSKADQKSPIDYQTAQSEETIIAQVLPECSKPLQTFVIDSQTVQTTQLEEPPKAPQSTSHIDETFAIDPQEAKTTESGGNKIAQELPKDNFHPHQKSYIDSQPVPATQAEETVKASQIPSQIDNTSIELQIAHTTESEETKTGQVLPEDSQPLQKSHIDSQPVPATQAEETVKASQITSKIDNTSIDLQIAQTTESEETKTGQVLQVKDSQPLQKSFIDSQTVQTTQLEEPAKAPLNTSHIDQTSAIDPQKAKTTESGENEIAQVLPEDNFQTHQKSHIDSQSVPTTQVEETVKASQSTSHIDKKSSKDPETTQTTESEETKIGQLLPEDSQPLQKSFTDSQRPQIPHADETGKTPPNASHIDEKSLITSTIAQPIQSEEIKIVQESQSSSEADQKATMHKRLPPSTECQETQISYECPSEPRIDSVIDQVATMNSSPQITENVSERINTEDLQRNVELDGAVAKDQNENIIFGAHTPGPSVEDDAVQASSSIPDSSERSVTDSRRNSSKAVLQDITGELQNTDSKALQELLEVKESLKPVSKDTEQEKKVADQPLSMSKEVEQRVHRLKSIDDGDITVLEGSRAPPSATFTPIEDITSPDRAFWLIFSGEYTKAMSKDWHSGHFCCWQCDESLTGQRYVLRDDHPYCIKCYEQVFANTCDECSKVIGIDSKDLSYKDKHWHEACFLCSKCRVSLVDKQFGSKADKIYCGNCYDAQFASRCDGCGQIFRAGTKKMEYKTRQWHEQCFCCCVCKTPIGTKSFIPREQEIYCAGCYEEKFATRCVKCNKIITSGGVTYKNEPWHRECFTCTNCSTSLAGQRFTSRDDKPYCAECFGELFAKRCTACSKPITGIGGTKFISFEDRHWHNDCFICASCRSSLVGRGFITDAEDILCTECAKQKLM